MFITLTIYDPEEKIFKSRVFKRYDITVKENSDGMAVVTSNGVEYVCMENVKYIKEMIKK